MFEFFPFAFNIARLPQHNLVASINRAINLSKTGGTLLKNRSTNYIAAGKEQRLFLQQTTLREKGSMSAGKK